MKSKMLDTSIDGYKAVGIVITQEQLNDLGFLNAVINADRERGVEADPVFYMTVLLRIMGVLPEDATTEPTYPLGRFIEAP